jgi:lysophospholipase L1-like esterase
LIKRQALKYYFFTLFLFLSIVELIIRLIIPSLTTYPEKNGLGYISNYKVQNKTWYFKHGPNYVQKRKQTEFSYILKSNSLGIFAKDPLDVNQKKHKILCLGDSFTEGVGANQNESWPSFLQAKLENKFPDSFEVINAGIGGSDVFYMWKLYEDILHVYKPDHIIMFIGESDLIDVFIRGGDERFQSDSSVAYKKAPWFEPFFKHSYIIRAFLLNVMEYDFTLTHKGHMYQELLNNCDLIEQKFIEINQKLSAKNIKFSVIIHPVPYEIERGKYNIKEFAKIADNKQYEGINFITKSKELGYKIPSDFRPYYWPIDGHYTPKGYHLIADIIFDIFYSKQKND